MNKDATSKPALIRTKFTTFPYFLPSDCPTLLSSMPDLGVTSLASFSTPIKPTSNEDLQWTVQDFPFKDLKPDAIIHLAPPALGLQALPFHPPGHDSPTKRKASISNAISPAESFKKLRAESLSDDDEVQILEDPGALTHFFFLLFCAHSILTLAVKTEPMTPSTSLARVTAGLNLRAVDHIDLTLSGDEDGPPVTPSPSPSKKRTGPNIFPLKLASSMALAFTVYDQAKSDGKKVETAFKLAFPNVEFKSSTLYHHHSYWLKLKARYPDELKTAIADPNHTWSALVRLL